MLPKFHILLGFFFSAILFFIFPEITFFPALIIFLSSFLIDVDHYLFYVITKKDFSLKNAFEWFIQQNKKFMKLSYREKLKLNDQVPCIFHGIEAVIVLVILSNFSVFFIYVLIGFLFHEILDFIYLTHHGFTIKHLGSQTYNILKYKKIH